MVLAGSAVFAVAATLTVFAASGAGMGFIVLLAAVGTSLHAFPVFTAIATVFAAILTHRAFAVFAAILAVAALLFRCSTGLGGSILTIVLAALMQLEISFIRSGEVLCIVTGSGNGFLDLLVAGTGIGYCQNLGFHIPVGFGSAGAFGCRFDGFLTHAAVTPNLDILGFGFLGKGRNREEAKSEKT